VAFIWPDRNGMPFVWTCPAEGGPAQQLCPRPAALEPVDGTDRRDVAGGPRWSPVEPCVAFISTASRGSGTSIWTCRQGEAEPIEVTQHVGDDRTARWAPDGRTLAFVGDRDGRDDIQVVPARGGRATQLTYDRFDNTDLDWSPDGRWLAYISQRSDTDLFSNNVCLVPSGGGAVRVLTHGLADNDRSPRWSPDGHDIAFMSNRGDTDDLWAVDPDGNNLRRLTDGLGERADPQWSPDGRWLAYTQLLHGDVDVWLMPSAGGEPRKLTDGGVNRAPRWSPDGTRLLYLHAGPGSPPDLWTVEPFAPESRACQLTHVADERLSGMDFCVPRAITYPSRDKSPIEALLYEPARPNGAALVWIHGGPNDAHMNGWEPLLQFLAQRGYTIVAPNYRGSTGYGKAFMEANTGAQLGVDVDDWVSAADVLRTLPGVDARKLGIIGHSAGGYATLLTLGLAPQVFAVGVARSAPTDWFSYWEHTRMRWTHRLRMKLMGLPSRNTEIYTQRSPIAHAHAFQAPVLMLHGELDAGVPSSQALEMHAALVSTGKTCESHVYPGEGHELSRAAAITDSTARIERFLASVLSAIGAD
jgi:dipeptidyl aminopeptidase/acylaminoacyl peptidase